MKIIQEAINNKSNLEQIEYSKDGSESQESSNIISGFDWLTWKDNSC